MIQFIGIHRAQVRYWYLKNARKDFHIGSIGGARYQLFDAEEKDSVLEYILQFLSVSKNATLSIVAKELSDAFEKNVTVKVCYCLYQLIALF